MTETLPIWDHSALFVELFIHLIYHTIHYLRQFFYLVLFPSYHLCVPHLSPNSYFSNPIWGDSFIANPFQNCTLSIGAVRSETFPRIYLRMGSTNFLVFLSLVRLSVLTSVSLVRLPFSNQLFVISTNSISPNPILTFHFGYPKVPPKRNTVLVFFPQVLLRFWRPVLIE